MPDTTSDAFLQGQGIPVDLREIEIDARAALGTGGRDAWAGRSPNIPT